MALPDNPAMTKFVRVEATGQDGVREITAAGWDGKVLRMTRDAYLKWRKAGADKLATACVHVLFADDFVKTGAGQRFLCVGRVGTAAQPSESSEKDKPFWSVALVFTSAGGWMTAEHARAVEAAMVEWAREASRYEVANSPADSTAPAAPLDLVVQAFLEPIRSVLEFAGVDVFEFNPEALYTLSRGPKFGRIDKATAKVRSAAAKTIEICADSRIGVNQLPETLEKVAALVDAGVATFDSTAGAITFTRATQMTAGGVFDTILGTFPKDWVNRSRRSLRDVFDEQKAPRAASASAALAATDATAVEGVPQEAPGSLAA
jgi:hypothetical protein